MIKRKLFGLIALLSVALMLGLTACSAQDLQSYQGILNKIDSLSGNVTVTLKDGTTTTFNLADVNLDTIVNALGNVSLDLGDNITIQKDIHGKVKCLKVQNAEADGVIKTLGTDNITITTEKKGDITLLVTPETLIITMSAGISALSNLQVGQTVEARYDVTSMKALMIKVDFQKDEANIQGTIKAIGTDNTTITIAAGTKGDISVKVTPATVIWIWGKVAATASDLKVAQHVVVKYNLTTLQALNITVGSVAENHSRYQIWNNHFNWGFKGNQGNKH